METRIQLALIGPCLVLDNEELLFELIDELREKKMEREVIREIILQTYLFDGYPTALLGHQLLNLRWPGKAVPIEPPLYDQWQEWYSRGKALYEKIYGSVAEKLQENTLMIAPELADWMIVEGYGKVLSRSNVSSDLRELANVAVLAVKNKKRQLHSHVRGAVRCGVPRDELILLANEIDQRFQKNTMSAIKSILDTMTT